MALKHLTNFIKGMAVGVATLVPGVSGGTMSIILGIYDGLIHAVSNFFENWKKNFIYLFVIALGGGLGILIFSRLLESAVNTYPHIMRFLFMGVIIGGLPVLFRKANESGQGERKGEISGYLFLILGAAIVLLMTSKPEAVADLATSDGIAGMVFLFIAGIILAIALVLPGISGSFMLLVLGLYNLFLNAINTMNIAFLIPLALGVGLGTFGSAKVIERFLEKHPRQTYMLIIGLVLGSLWEVYPGIPLKAQILPSIVVFIIGFAALYWIGKKGYTN